MEENIIYLLLGLVYIIYQAWSSMTKGKKKPGETTSPGTPAKPNPSIDDIESVFDEILGRKREEVTIPYDEYEYEEEKTYEAPKAQSSPYTAEMIEKANRLSTLDTFEGEGVNMLDDDLSEPEIVEGENTVDFDLQQAVIFSEILRRPYA